MVLKKWEKPMIGSITLNVFRIKQFVALWMGKIIKETVVFLLTLDVVT